MCWMDVSVFVPRETVWDIHKLFLISGPLTLDLVVIEIVSFFVAHPFTDRIISARPAEKRSTWI